MASEEGDDAGDTLASADPGDEKDIISVPYNHIFVVWEEDTPGNNEIYFTVGTV